MAHDKRGRRALRRACLGAALLLALHARAQPLVRVQAGTQIVLHSAQGSDGLELRGALLDDLGAPLAGRMVQVEVRDERTGEAVQQLAVRSADDGSFGAAAAQPAGAYRVRVRFAGDSHHAESRAERTVDLARAEVRLAFIEPRTVRLDLDAERQPVALRASSRLSGEGLSIEVRNERGAVVTRGTTDADGMLRAVVPAAALGEAGHGKLIAHSQPDALRGGALAEVAVLRWRATQLALRAQVDARRQQVTLEGSLRDRRSGLAGEAIGIFDGNTHVTTVLTDRAGRFRHDGLASGARPDAQRTLRLQARFDSDASWLGSSRSEVVELALVPEAPVSPLWLLLPLCSSAALVWLLLRRPAAERAARKAPPAVGIGIHPGRGRARGRAEQRRIAGTVRDALTERPVRGAPLSLRGPDASALELVTGDDGSFRSDELRDGEWTLSISAAGYATLSGTLAIPHRGEWADMDVQLQSLRSAAVAAYRPAAMRVLPDAELWRRWTPRETLQHAQQKGRATEPFVQLTQQVEHAAYSGTPPTADDVAAVEQTASEALARFPETPSQPGGSGLLRATIPHRR
jgi:hypothetical protein